MLLDGRIVFIVGGLHPPWNGLVTEENYAGNKDPIRGNRCNAQPRIGIQCTAVKRTDSEEPINMNRTKYVILGGGMVAGYAAKELVERGLKPGELTIVSSDSALPYERPPLSKGFLAGKDSLDGILINPAEWYREHGIDVKLRTVVAKVDASSKSLQTSSGEQLGFENLLIATGAQPRKLDCPGKDLEGIYYLRSMSDSESIRAKASIAKSAVVIGGGFIGMEVASVLAQKNVETTLVIREDRVWSRVFSPEISAFFDKYYSSRGVHVVKNTGVDALNGTGSVHSAKLSNGQEIACDLVVAGIGVTPTIGSFGHNLRVENGFVVNEFLETGAAGIYAAGDVANYPDRIFGKRRRFEHWDNAVSQGQHWSRVVTGDRQPFVHVPYFFSDVFDLAYELWGDSDGAEEVVIRGDAHTSSFSAWWLKDSRVVAAFVMNRPDEERNVAPEWIRTGHEVSATNLADAKQPLSQAA
jgi:NADPH-dependent 2,4-dienoyl-CoA reductase/sulfur reductase-like enzyme